MRDRRLGKITTYILAISLIPIFLMIAFEVPAYTKSFYAYEFSKNDTYNYVDMEEEDLLDVRDHIIKYLRIKTDDLQIETVVDGEKIDFFSERELHHMVDVQNLFKFGRIARLVFIAIAIISAVLMYKERVKKHEIGTAFKRVTIGTGIVVILVVIAAIISFDKIFTLFHLLLFDNDLWILNPKVDRLVNIVPTPFFIDAGILVALVFLVLTATMFIIGHRLEKTEDIF